MESLLFNLVNAMIPCTVYWLSVGWYVGRAYIDQHLAEVSNSSSSVGWISVKYWSIHGGCYSTNTWFTCTFQPMYWPILDRYATDTQPIFNRHLTDSRPIYWLCINQHLADTRPTLGWCINLVSVNILVDSVNHHYLE